MADETLLCKQLQKISFSETLPQHVITARSYHSTSISFYDKHHLDKKGKIKETFLIERREFLIAHGLLKDEITFSNHRVFKNSHLYDLNQPDKYGSTNLERMLHGLAPIAKNGTDYLVIHHFDQTHQGDWVVLLNSFHEKYDRDLHTQVKIKGGVNRQLFSHERMAYWQQVAKNHLENKFLTLAKL